MTSELAKKIDKIKELYRPETDTAEEVNQKLEALYDEVALIAAQYREDLESDDPLSIYLDYFLRDPIDVMTDEAEEPELYATVPLSGEPIFTKAGQINPMTTVRVTQCTVLGDVGITVNLAASRGFETRVMWDSLIRYRHHSGVKPETVDISNVS